MRVAVACTLPADQARARVEKCLGELMEKYADRISEVQIDWQGNSAGLSFLLLKPLPMKIAAELTVKADKVVLEGMLPLLAWPFRPQIEALIGDHLRTCLA